MNARVVGVSDWILFANLCASIVVIAWNVYCVVRYKYEAPSLLSLWSLRVAIATLYCIGYVVYLLEVFPDRKVTDVLRGIQFVGWFALGIPPVGMKRRANHYVKLAEQIEGMTTYVKEVNEEP